MHNNNKRRRRREDARRAREIDTGNRPFRFAPFLRKYASLSRRTNERSDATRQVFCCVAGATGLFLALTAPAATQRRARERMSRCPRQARERAFGRARDSRPDRLATEKRRCGFGQLVRAGSLHRDDVCAGGTQRRRRRRVLTDCCCCCSGRERAGVLSR